MTRIQLPPVLRRWRFLAAVVGVSALAGGGVLLAAVSDPATALAFHTVPTTRILDTRPATQVGDEAEPLGLGETIDLHIKNLPTDATAVSINVTVVDGTEGSFLTVYPTGSARPTTSTVNWDSAGAEANSATVVLGTDQSVTIYNLKGTVNVVIDLLGYYAPITNTPTGPTTPTTPTTPPVTTPTTPTVLFYATSTNAPGVQLTQSLLFDTVVTDVGGVIAFGSPASTFEVPVAGVYRISFSATAVNANEFDIQVNQAAPGFAQKFGSAGGGATTAGSAILTLATGDLVTVDNLTSPGTVDLTPGGAIDASITIELLSV